MQCQQFFYFLPGLTQIRLLPGSRSRANRLIHSICYCVCYGFKIVIIQVIVVIVVDKACFYEHCGHFSPAQHRQPRPLLNIYISKAQLFKLAVDLLCKIVFHSAFIVDKGLHSAVLIGLRCRVAVKRYKIICSALISLLCFADRRIVYILRSGVYHIISPAGEFIPKCQRQVQVIVFLKPALIRCTVVISAVPGIYHNFCCHIKHPAPVVYSIYNM